MFDFQRRRSLQILTAFSCAAGLVAPVGCSQTSQESQVSGTVTLDGNPIGPGIIVFKPTSDGKPATGNVENDGSFTLMTGRDATVGAGGYEAMVSIREVPQNVKPGDRPPPGKSLIPEKYEDFTLSGLKYEVQPGRNTIDVKLVSK